jgi:hypothetical protein
VVTNQEGLTREVIVTQYPLEYITNQQGWYSYRSDFYTGDNAPTTYENKGSRRVAADWEWNSWKYSTSVQNNYFFGSKVSSMYKKHVRRSDRMAREALGLPKKCTFMRVQHSCIPVLKSQSEEVSGLQREAVLASLSRVRNDGNINMTLFLSYMYHKSLVINKRQSCKHISLAAVTQKKLESSISDPSRSMLCINDVKLSEEKFQAYRELIIDMFEKRFPSKSRFEK